VSLNEADISDIEWLAKTENYFMIFLVFDWRAELEAVW